MSERFTTLLSMTLASALQVLSLPALHNHSFIISWQHSSALLFRLLSMIFNAPMLRPSLRPIFLHFTMESCISSRTSGKFSVESDSVKKIENSHKPLDLLLSEYYCVSETHAL